MLHPLASLGGEGMNIKVDGEGGAKMVTLKGLFNAGDEIWVQTEV